MMPHTTTRLDIYVTKYYPFGHAVNTVVDTVCWFATDWDLGNMRDVVRLDRVSIESAEREQPGVGHPGCGVQADSIGARWSIDSRSNRMQQPGRNADAEGGSHRQGSWKSHRASHVNGIGRVSNRSANFEFGNQARQTVMQMGGTTVPATSRKTRSCMSSISWIADTEKARSANSGPSRNSMSDGVVGTRSDSRQTA